MSWGETPQDILTELERIYVDEVGDALAADIKIKDDRIDVFIECCILKHACTDLQKEDIKPFVCVPMMLAANGWITSSSMVTSVTSPSRWCKVKVASSKRRGQLLFATCHHRKEKTR